MLNDTKAAVSLANLLKQAAGQAIGDVYSVAGFGRILG
jgi:hypothetical protein